MSKDVIDKKSQNISVQDELYREILLGFQDRSEMTSKKHVQLSTIQKQRVEKVVPFLLKNEKTNYFTKTWVKNLSSIVDIDALKKRLFGALQIQENEEDDDIEEAEEEKKNPFNFGTVMKVYDAIRTIKLICRLFKKIKSITSELENFSDEFKKIGDDGFGKKMKRILLMEHLQSFLLNLLHPMVGKLCNVVFTYYDEKLIPAIAEKIEKLKEQGQTLLAKSATGFIPVIGAFAVAAWDLYDAGCALVDDKSRGYDVAYYGASALLNVGGGVASLTGAGYVVQGGIVALKMTVGGARLAVKIQEALTLDEDEQKQLRGKVQEIANEKFEPIVNGLTEKIEDLRGSINNLERITYDYFYEQLNVAGRINQQINEIEKGVNFVNRVQQGVKAIDVKNTVDSIGGKPYSRSRLSFQYKRDKSDTSFILKEVGKIHKSMRKAHEVKYNFYVSDEDLGALFDPEKGLHILRFVKSLIETIDLFFVKVYTIMFDYFYTIIDNHKTVINDVKNNQQKIKTNSVGEVFFQDYLFPNILERITNEVEKRGKNEKRTELLNQIRQNYNNFTASPNNEVNDFIVHPIWMLSRKTLRPFIPHFIDNYLDGFYIKLENSDGKEKEFVVQFTKDMPQKLLEENADLADGFSTLQWYQNLCQQFNKMKIDKKYPTTFEMEYEKETNELVVEIYNNLLKALV